MFFLSLFLIFAGGIVLYELCRLAKLPPLVGYLLWGILLGYFSLIDTRITAISSEIRKIALIIILLKAGLSLNLNDLKKVGRPAILMSFVPAVVEMCAVGLLAPLFFNLTYTESFLLGSVLGAVSPAVVVPMMSRLIEEKRGTKHGVPHLIIAGSSIDDIIMIVFYQTFLSLESGESVSWTSFMNIPISIIMGVAVGVLLGFGIAFISKRIHIRDSLKIAFLIGVACGLVYLEDVVSPYFGFSSLLAVIALGVVYSLRSRAQGERILIRTGKMWAVAEIILFVLVGASIKIEYLGSYFLPALGLVASALALRIIAVEGCLIKTKLTKRERLFTGISYIPKATVQASIGGGLLDLGTKMNNEGTILAGVVVLSVSVVAIIITAPLGAIGMNLTYKKLLPDDSEKLETPPIEEEMR